MTIGEAIVDTLKRNGCPEDLLELLEEDEDRSVDSVLREWLLRRQGDE